MIYGYRSDDTINAGGGENHVVGGAGNDDIVTGVNDDLIKGGDGADRIFSRSEEPLSAANVNAPIYNDIIFGQGGNPAQPYRHVEAGSFDLVTGRATSIFGSLQPAGAAGQAPGGFRFRRACRR